MAFKKSRVTKEQIDEAIWIMATAHGFICQVIREHWLTNPEMDMNTVLETLERQTKLAVNKLYPGRIE
jgi:hypothetical protein